jgi:hypothetical protein
VFNNIFLKWLLPLFLWYKKVSILTDFRMSMSFFEYLTFAAEHALLKLKHCNCVRLIPSCTFIISLVRNTFCSSKRSQYLRL